LYQKLQIEKPPKYSDATITSISERSVPIAATRIVRIPISPMTRGIHFSSVKSAGLSSAMPM